MITPEFPYKNNQIILSSDRVLLNAKSDCIFLFGKKMVAIASTETVNIDAKEKILLDCDKIELGHKAEVLGEPIVMGNKLIYHLELLISALQLASSKLASVSETGAASSWMAIREAGNEIHTATEYIALILNDPKDYRYPLSNVTYTR